MASHSCCFQNFVFEFQQFDFNMSLFYPPWSLLSFLDVSVHVTHQIWEVFNQCFFKYIFCLFLFCPSGIPVIHVLICLMVSRKSFRFCSFFFLLFFFLPLRLDNFRCITFKCADPSFSLLRSAVDSF